MKDYVHCVAKQRYPFETCHILGKKMPRPVDFKTTLHFMYATCFSPEHLPERCDFAFLISCVKTLAV